MTDTHDLDALHEAATPAPWEKPGFWDVRPGVLDSNGHSLTFDMRPADSALIVALRNAYANGDLVPCAERDAETDRAILWENRAMQAERENADLRGKVEELERMVEWLAREVWDWAPKPAGNDNPTVSDWIDAARAAVKEADVEVDADCAACISVGLDFSPTCNGKPCPHWSRYGRVQHD